MQFYKSWDYVSQGMSISVVRNVRWDVYFYHIAHMAKHLQQGGCGIRTFIDLWILDNLPTIDTLKRNDLLKSGGLLQFSQSA